MEVKKKPKLVSRLAKALRECSPIKKTNSRSKIQIRSRSKSSSTHNESFQVTLGVDEKKRANSKPQRTPFAEATNFDLDSFDPGSASTLPLLDDSQISSLARGHRNKVLLSKAFFALLQNTFSRESEQRDELLSIQLGKGFISQRNHVTQQLALYSPRILTNSAVTKIGVASNQDSSQMHIEPTSNEVTSQMTLEFVGLRYRNITLITKSFVALRRHVKVNASKRSARIQKERRREKRQDAQLTLSFRMLQNELENLPKPEAPDIQSSTTQLNEDYTGQKPCPHAKPSKHLNISHILFPSEAVPAGNQSTKSLNRKASEDPYLDYVARRVLEKYQASLKQKSLAGWKRYLLRGQHNREFYLKRSLLILLKNLSVQNRSGRRLSEIAGKIHLRHFFWVKQLIFSSWRLQKQKIDRATFSRQFILAKKVFIAFQRVHQQAMAVEHLSQRQVGQMLRFCFDALAINYYRKKQKLSFRARVLTHMNLVRERQVLKAWFNSICVLRRVQKLEVIMQVDSRVTLRKSMRLWKMRVELQRFRVSNYVRFSKRMFDPWLELTRSKVLQKQRLVLLRATKLNAIAFNAWKSYHNGKQREKSNQLRILRRRALQLQAHAFNGLAINAHVRKHAQNLNKVASYYLALRLLKKSFASLQTQVRRTRAAHEIAGRHNWLLARRNLKNWHQWGKLTYRLNKVSNRNDIQMMYRCFREFKRYQVLRCRHRGKIESGLLRYGRKLTSTAFKSLIEYIFYRRFKAFKGQRAASHHNAFLQKKALTTFAWYAARTKDRRLALEQSTKQRMLKAKQALWLAWKQYRTEREYKHYGNRLFCAVQHRKLRDYFSGFACATFETRQRRELLGSVQQIKDFHRMQVCFDQLVSYREHKAYKEALAERSQNFRAFMLKKRGLKAFVSRSLYGSEKAVLIRGVEETRRKLIFVRWFNLVHDSLPQERKADSHFKQTLIRHMSLHARNMTQIRLKRQRLQRMSKDFYEHTKRVRALRYLYFFSQARTSLRSREGMARQIWLSRVFRTWRATMPLLRLQSSHNAQSSILLRHSLAQKALLGLGEHSRRKIKARKIVSLFADRRDALVQTICISAMFEAVCETKLKVAGFCSVMEPVIKKSLSVALRRWSREAKDRQHGDAAQVFFLKHKGATLKRLAFQALMRHFCRKQSSIANAKLAKKHYLRQLVRHGFLKIHRYYMGKYQFSQVGKTIRRSKRHRLLSSSFSTLQAYSRRKSTYSRLVRQGRLASQKMCMAVCFAALARRLTLKHKCALVASTSRTSQLSGVLKKWSALAKFSGKIGRMVEILAEQNKVRFFSKAFATIARHNQVNIALEATKSSRSFNLVGMAFAALQTKLLRRKIVANFRQKKRTQLAQAVLGAIQRQTRAQASHRIAISKQIDLYEAEERQNLLMGCWRQFLRLVFKRRARDHADHKWASSLMARGLLALKTYARMKSSLQARALFQRANFLHRSFNHWREAHFNERKLEKAQRVLILSKMRVLWQEWQLERDHMTLVGNFRSRWGDRILKSMAVKGFQQNTVVFQFQKIVVSKITFQRNQTLKRDGIRLMQEAYQQRKVQCGLRSYYLHRLVKRSILGWKAFTAGKSQQRLNRIKIRYALSQNKCLARPLLVLRMFETFKAFQSLKLNSQKLILTRKQRHVSNYAFYLRLLRKSFYALRLNAANRFQFKKSRQINQMLIKRRWFEYLRQAALERKNQRQQKTNAAIFRFLKLQRRAFDSMARWHQKSRNRHILHKYAMAQYYKMLTKKGFYSLEIWKLIHREKRRLRAHDETDFNSAQPPFQALDENDFKEPIYS